MKRITLLSASLGVILGSTAWAAEPAPLQLETKIPLGEVSGRIDHLAIDLARQRLFVAELGNNSLGVVDLKSRQTIRTITGLGEPQGVGYAASTDTVYVASARDGSVSLFQGADLAPGGRIELGEDADNIRIDDAANRIYVGYGRALAVIDAANRAKIADIPLTAHPEGFQLDPASHRIFVNIPEARQIAVVDRAAGKPIATWPVPEARANFPMAVDDAAHRVMVVFRHPARLVALAAQDGAVAANVETCGDADDVFVDAKRRRVYVSCGEGFIDVFAMKDGTYARIGHRPTASGARTALFVPELDRLFLAVRASGSEPAAIWVFRPAP